MMTEHRLNICRYSSAPSDRHLPTTWSREETQAEESVYDTTWQQDDLHCLNPTTNSYTEVFVLACFLSGAVLNVICPTQRHSHQNCVDGSFTQCLPPQ